jgi:glyoxylase-like metal-dependent hydrolase (beta-lactamase superfamily II)
VSAIGEFDHLHIHPADRSFIPQYRGTIVDIEPGYKFDLGDRQIEVIDLIGHTAGSIGFLDATNHRLFTGDALGMNPCYMHFTALPLESLLWVVKRVESLQPTWTEIWSGHFNHFNKPIRQRIILPKSRILEKRGIS